MARLFTGVRRSEHITPVLRQPASLATSQAVSGFQTGCVGAQSTVPPHLAEDCQIVASTN